MLVEITAELNGRLLHRRCIKSHPVELRTLLILDRHLLIQICIAKSSSLLCHRIDRRLQQVERPAVTILLTVDYFVQLDTRLDLGEPLP